jgi:hypothetical protein
MGDADFIKGQVDTGFLERFQQRQAPAGEG